MSASTPPVAVSDCIATLCSAYHEGASIFQQIKSKRKGLDISAQELELSITCGESLLRDQYERSYSHSHSQFGELFAHGDGNASDICPGHRLLNML